MPSKLSQKVIEAGLVPKHTLQLLKMWGMVPEDAEEKDLSLLGDQEQLDKMAAGLISDIEELVAIEKDLPVLREAQPDLVDIWNRYKAPVHIGPGKLRPSHAAMDMPWPGFVAIFKDEMAPGDCFYRDDIMYTVDDVEIRYRGEEPEFYVCRLEASL